MDLWGDDALGIFQHDLRALHRLDPIVSPCLIGIVFDLPFLLFLLPVGLSCAGPSDDVFLPAGADGESFYARMIFVILSVDKNITHLHVLLSAPFTSAVGYIVYF